MQLDVTLLNIFCYSVCIRLIRPTCARYCVYTYLAAYDILRLIRLVLESVFARLGLGLGIRLATYGLGSLILQVGLHQVQAFGLGGDRLAGLELGHDYVLTAVMLVLVLVLKDSLRNKMQSLSLTMQSLSLLLKSLSWSLNKSPWSCPL